jgi:hypothetical protein
MATDHILTLLIAERDKLNKAIDALGGSAKPAGRPAKSHAAPAATAPRVAAAPKKKKRKPLTAAQKKAHSDRMKAFWAARRKKQTKA